MDAHTDLLELFNLKYSLLYSGRRFAVTAKCAKKKKKKEVKKRKEKDQSISFLPLENLLMQMKCYISPYLLVWCHLQKPHSPSFLLPPLRGLCFVPPDERIHSRPE